MCLKPRLEMGAKLPRGDCVASPAALLCCASCSANQSSLCFLHRRPRYTADPAPPAGLAHARCATLPAAPHGSADSPAEHPCTAFAALPLTQLCLRPRSCVPAFPPKLRFGPCMGVRGMPLTQRRGGCRLRPGLSLIFSKAISLPENTPAGAARRPTAQAAPRHPRRTLCSPCSATSCAPGVSKRAGSARDPRHPDPARTGP